MLKLVLFCSTVLLAACAPEVGSAAWCQRLQDQPKGDWTANQLADFAKHCVFN